MAKKSVVYLFGAGATQAEIQYVGDSMRLLSKDLSGGIIERIDRKKIKSLVPLKNELSSPNSDIEHLITLYASTGTPHHDQISKRLKELFREEILERLKEFEKRAVSKKKMFVPSLMSALIGMHDIEKINEDLVGLITLNYDNMLEKAMRAVKGEINYVVGAKNFRSGLKIKRGQGIPILKLHGSFNWRKDYPLVVSDQNKIKKEDQVLWIPPGVLKNKDRYPFDLIWSVAKELLQCDILRVVGCSLNRNDWQLLALLFAMQRINKPGQFTIELIDYRESGDAIKRNYPYLKVATILEISEFLDYVSDLYGSDNQAEISESVSVENPKANIFESWLRAKGNALNKQDLSAIKTSKYFEKLVNQT